MPFVPAHVRMLRKQLKMTLDAFGSDLGRHMFDGNGENISFCGNTVVNWESGRSRPTIRTLDALYTYAASKGYSDVQFYVPPSLRVKRSLVDRTA